MISKAKMNHINAPTIFLMTFLLKLSSDFIDKRCVNEFI